MNICLSHELCINTGPVKSLDPTSHMEFTMERGIELVALTSRLC